MTGAGGTAEGWTLPDRDRFARHRAISWWDQELLASRVAIVAGCGALGNEVAKNLALVGVGTLVLVDFDRIERSNLVRSVLFRERDIGRGKAEVAAERLRDLYPALKAIPVSGDLNVDLGLGLVRRAHLVLGCLDSVQARFALNRLCLRAGTPWLDGGLGVDACQVARYDPGIGACYECHVSSAVARRFARRYSCSGLARPDQGTGVPTTAITASLAAALMVEEALLQFHGGRERNRPRPETSSSALAPVHLETTHTADLNRVSWQPVDPARPATEKEPGAYEGLRPGQRLTLHLAPYRLTIDDLPADPDCCAHGEVPEAAAWPGTPATTSVADLLGCEPGEVDLGFDLVTSLECPQCGPEAICAPRARLRREAALCPACGLERAAQWTRRVSGTLQWAERPLGDLGVPEHAIVGVFGECDRYVELGGSILDIPAKETA